MSTIEDHETTKKMLLELGIPVHRVGYKLLCEAVPQYAADDWQTATKDLYPSLAKRFGLTNGNAAERPIRCAIAAAWENRDPAVWAQYFPRQEKVPSNMVFIATLAERLK